MPAITTGSHPSALWPGVAAFFGQLIEEYPKEYARIYEELPSEKAYELEQESHSFGLAVEKPHGEALTYDTHEQGYQIKYPHSLWALGYIVTYEEREDNQYLNVSFDRAEMLAQSLGQTKELNGAFPFNVGFDATGNPFADGVALFSASHPTPYGNQSNLLSNAADFSEAAVEDMAVQVSLTRDNRGKITHTRLKLIMVHPNDQFNLARVLGSPLTTSNQGNAINVARKIEGLEGMVNHFFSSSTAWFGKTTYKNGFKLYQREGVQFAQDNDGDTFNLKAKTWERYRFGVSEWRSGIGSAGA